MLAGFISCSAIANADAGIVTSIVDGDTLVINTGGSDKKIRLLNVDSPETKDPAKPVECLGREATEFLAYAVPVGSKVKLKFDVEKEDKYGRILAAVFTDDGTLVNAEIARQGLGIALVVGENKAYFEQVKSAQQEAEAAERGLFGKGTQCTLPAQVQAATTALTLVIEAPASTTSAAAEAAIASAATAIAAAKALETLLKIADKSVNEVLWVAYTPANLASKLGSLSGSINQAQTRLTSRTAEKTSLADAEAKAAARKAADEAAAVAKKAADEAAQKAAEIAAAQAAATAAVEAERVRNLPPAYVPPPYVPPAPPAYVPPAENPGGGPPGYTGKRCYAPGGKTYRPC